MSRKIVSFVSGMSGRVRASLIAVVAAVALVAVIVPLQAGASSVNVASQLDGYLTLGFTPGATDITATGFHFYPSATSDSLGTPVTAYQGLAVSGCNVTTPTTAGSASYAKLSTNYLNGTYTGVGATTSNGNLIGLGAKPKNGTGASGTSCGRVDNGESLTLTLLGTSLQGYLIDQADLDIEAKFGTKVNADLKLGNTTVSSAQFTDSIADSGPNCSGCNNWSFKIPPQMDEQGHPIFFDTIVLTPMVGPGGNQNNVGFTLEGGQGDPFRAAPQGSTGLRAQLHTRQSVIHISFPPTGTLDCGQVSDPITGNDITTTVERLDNADNSTCVVIPYALGTGDDSVSFRKNLLDQGAAQFVLSVTWAPEAANTPPGNTHTTQITYDGTNYHTLLWCTGVTYDVNGDVVTALFPSGESYCLVSHDEHVLLDGTISTHERIYGFGDPGLKR